MVQWLKRINMKDKMKKKTFWGRLLAAFFVLMALSTVVSRAADSVIVPRVRLERASSGSLNYTIKGSGSIIASEGKLVTLPEKLRIREITKPGTTVEEGGPLAVADTDELIKVLDEEKAALAKLRLQLQKEQLDAVPDAATPQAYSAGKSLELAREHFDEASAKLEEAAKAEEAAAVERQKRLEEKKKAAYDTFMKQGGESSSEAKAAYEEAVRSAEEEAGNLKAEKDAQMDALIQNRDAMQDALEQAQAAYDIARAEDDNAASNRQKASQGSGITQEGMKIDIEQQQKKVDWLQEVMDADGVITSPVKGTVTENSLTEGMVTSGQEYIRIGTGGYEFRAAVDKDNAKKLKAGDSMEVEFPGKKDKKRLKITDIRAEQSGGSGGQASGSEGEAAAGAEAAKGQTGQESIMYLTAKLDGDDYAAGTEGSYVIDKESDIRYDWILPVEAIREDQSGTFCLISRKKDTILGEEYVAERLRLVKKAKDLNKVAVEGNLDNKTDVIIESSKEINEGDRFQIEEKD
ncbi:HlyD family efflux transporter periplasmic adaptor subunit [Dorea sp. D27]|uniref:HlyD family efflux transporter periplasmic adaptor subunit n=1 Tax=Dorea sp. D27 TaxID=658665 RepID=UPI0006737C1A|nr:HlyD family efflux transporter periplasmic adaptor subunit [Dorea sp. D27]